ncbi:MAG: hypothetical protein J6N21_20170 [Butyrivibrio sp.]|nr:hypothetical protein [Butyrivibrio sp.]
MSDEVSRLSFSLKRRRVLIHRSTLRALGLPQNIRFLLNKKKVRVAVQCCEAIDRDIFSVPDLKPSETFEISSINFLKIIYGLAKWDEERTYRVSGTLYKANRLIEFDLMDAETISDDDFVDQETVSLQIT